MNRFTGWIPSWIPQMPFTDNHQLDLDWILAKMRDVLDGLGEMVGYKESAEEAASAAADSATEAAGAAGSAQDSAAAAEETAGSINDSLNQIAVNTSRIDSLVANAGDTDGNSELLDIRVGYTGYTYQTAGSAVRSQVDDVVNMIDDLAYIESVPISFDTIENGVAYNTVNTDGTPWSAARTYIKSVEPGDRYKITTTVPGNAARVYWAVLYYNNDTYTTQGVGQCLPDTEILYTDLEFVIPEGVNKIVCTTLQSAGAVLKKVQYTPKNGIVNNYAVLENNVIKIKARYNTVEDLCIQMSKHGNNNLFDFEKIYTTQRTDTLNSNTDVYRMITNYNTDCFSPHQMYAINNGDGDGGSYFLTGGNHNRNGVPTATCTALDFWFDNVHTDTFEGPCEHVKIKWVNMIQGWNTFKTDGSGRAILKETITLDIQGSKINAIVEQLPLEDLYQSVYYGLASVNTAYPQLRYIAGSNRGLVTSNTNTNNGSLDCRRIVAFNTTTGDQQESYIYNEDLGTFNLTGQTYSAFTGNSKAYYAIIEPTSRRMNADQLYTLRGYYNFTSNR